MKKFFTGYEKIVMGNECVDLFETRPARISSKGDTPLMFNLNWKIMAGINRVETFLWTTFIVLLIVYVVAVCTYTEEEVSSCTQDELSSIVVERLSSTSALVKYIHCNTLDEIHVEVEPHARSYRELDALEHGIAEAIASLQSAH